MLLFGDVPVIPLLGLLLRDVFRGEFEASSCEEREEVVMVLAPAVVRGLEEQGQVLLASCIYATYFLSLV